MPKPIKTKLMSCNSLPKSMRTAVEYLHWKLKAGAVLEPSEPLAGWNEANWEVKGKEDLTGVQDQTFNMDLTNGYKVALSGWTHTRDYAFGFLRNLNGKATAVVSGLVPAAQYLFAIYSTDSSGLFHKDSGCSVNNGHEAIFRHDGYKRVVFNGVTTANPRGEITFEFDRKGHNHVHLSGIAIAAVTRPYSLVQRTGTEHLRQNRQSELEVGFSFLHLYQQCDAVLLLGGMGIESCGRPLHRDVASHNWKHKRTLPSSFAHGTVLLASCWAERYRLFRGAHLVGQEKLQCVSGSWYNSLEKPNLEGLSCEACVQVGARGYTAYDARNEQETFHSACECCRCPCWLLEKHDFCTAASPLVTMKLFCYLEVSQEARRKRTTPEPKRAFKTKVNVQTRPLKTIVCSTVVAC